MIFDPLNLNRPRRFKYEQHGNEEFTFEATYNSIDETRQDVQKRITDQFRKEFGEHLDGNYGADEGHGSK